MEDKVYLMQRTDVPCPACMKKKVLQETATEAYCDGCGQRYNKKAGVNTLIFQNK